MSDQSKEIENKLRSAIADVLSHRPKASQKPNIDADSFTQLQHIVLSARQLVLQAWSGFICPVFISLALASFSYDFLEKGEGNLSLDRAGDKILLGVAVIFSISAMLLGIGLHSFSFTNERVIMLSKLPCSTKDILKGARLQWLYVIFLLLISNSVWMSAFEFPERGLEYGGYVNCFLTTLLLTISAASVTLLSASIHCLIKRLIPALVSVFWVVIVICATVLALLTGHARLSKSDAEWSELYHKVVHLIPSTWAVEVAAKGEGTLTQFALLGALSTAGAVLWMMWPALAKWRLLEIPASTDKSVTSKEADEKYPMHHSAHELVQSLQSACKPEYAFEGRLERFISKLLQPLERIAYPVFARGRLMWSGNWIIGFFLTAVCLTIGWAVTGNLVWLEEKKVPTDAVLVFVGIMAYSGYTCLLLWPESGLEKKDEKYRNRLHHHDLSACVNAMLNPWAWAVMKCKVMVLRLSFMLPLVFIYEAVSTKMRTGTVDYLKLAWLLAVCGIIALSSILTTEGYRLGRLIKNNYPHRVLGAFLSLVRVVLICAYCFAVIYTFVGEWLAYTGYNAPYLTLSTLTMIASSLLMFQIQTWRIQSGQADWILTARKKIS